MSWEVHIDWQAHTLFVERLHAAEQSPADSFEYTSEWLNRAGAFAIDPTSLPLHRVPHHSRTLFGAMLDWGPDRWRRLLIERAVRKKTFIQKPYRDIDYVPSLDESSRLGALRFRDRTVQRRLLNLSQLYSTHSDRWQRSANGACKESHGESGG